MKEEFKHLVVRKPEEINQEYSEIIGKLGTFKLERAELSRLNDLRLERYEVIEGEEEKCLKRVLELKLEMTESQKEIQRKSEETKTSPQQTTAQDMRQEAQQ